MAGMEPATPTSQMKMSAGLGDGVQQNSSTAGSISATAATLEEKTLAQFDPDEPPVEPFSTFPSSSTVLDIAAPEQEHASPKGPAPSSSFSFWSRVKNAANVMDEYLAEWFGLNQSKYQWAVDEFMEQQLSGDTQGKPPSVTDVNEQHLHTIGKQQIMQRDTDQLADIKISTEL